MCGAALSCRELEATCGFTFSLLESPSGNLAGLLEAFQKCVPIQESASTAGCLVSAFVVAKMVAAREAGARGVFPVVFLEASLPQASAALPAGVMHAETILHAISIDKTWRRSPITSDVETGRFSVRSH